MNFTGTNILYLPQVSQATYLFKDIVLNSTGTYRVATSHYVGGIPSTGTWTGWLFHLQAGRIQDPSGEFIATYNTGESFSLSGWIDIPSRYRYLEVGNILSRSEEQSPSSGLLRSISIICPTGTISGQMSCDITIQATRIVSSGNLNSFPINGYCSGNLYSSTSQYVFNDAFQFYKSYEILLTGAPVAAFLDSRMGQLVNIAYLDNDSSSQNNNLNFDYQYSTTYGDTIGEFAISRSGLYSSGLVQIIDLNNVSGFSGLFNGEWSGNQFVYRQDSPDAMILSYFMTLSDAMGNLYPTSGKYEVSIPSTGTMMRAEYITGFRLTASGQYMNPPLIAVTGYYYSTGIQQSIGSLLFSSGCTGDLNVTFSSANNIGTGASGLLQTQPVTFVGVYSNGSKVFRTVYNYVTTNIGTGYTIAPRAIVNTGQYGAGCFDVPLASGYNQAWYAPFKTSGTLDVEAGWFTGVALCTTGIVGAGLTGYIVTGIDVYNIGTGYSSGRVPLMSFIRTGVDTLISGASGFFYMNTGSLNANTDWYVEAGIAGKPAINSGQFAGIIPMMDSNNLMYLKLMCSGVDITVPITGKVTITINNVTPPQSIVTYFSYAKYFDISTDALKKKVNPTLTFSINDDLSFLLTQNELDSLYSSAGYVNNSWPFSDGDFDF